MSDQSNNNNNLQPGQGGWRPSRNNNNNNNNNNGNGSGWRQHNSRNNNNNNNNNNGNNNPQQRNNNSRQGRGNRSGNGWRGHNNNNRQNNSNNDNNNNNNNNNNNSNNNNNNYNRGGHGRGRGNRRDQQSGFSRLAEEAMVPMSEVSPEVQTALAMEEKSFQDQKAKQEAAATESSASSSGPSTTPTDAKWREGLNIPEKDTRIKTEDVMSRKNIEFEDLALSRQLLMGIFEMGYERPSPIQEETIPFALLGRDILARAKNGTGKTAAYGIPVLEMISAELPYTQALVLVPTRELALQTSSVMKSLGKHLGLSIVVTTGGTDLKEDILRLMKPVHLIVATPGRLADLVNRRLARLSYLKLFVLDEADKLLSAEFEPLINKLLSYTPENRQIMLFSATFPVSVVHFRDRWQKNPHEVILITPITL